MSIKPYAFFIYLAAGSAAWPGIPVDETVICPVGGEEFTIKGTLSCSTMGRTMSFRPVTSCDWVTALPVCPSNGLPIYQEFTEDQITDLSAFIETDDYAVLEKLPPWQRAYGIATHLGQAGTELSFGLLLSALWYETQPLLKDDAMFDLFLREAESELIRSPEVDRPFINAILAYALAAAGRIEASKDKLVLAKQASDTPELLLQYISAIEGCLNDMQAKSCRPDAPFNP